MAKINLHALH